MLIKRIHVVSYELKKYIQSADTSLARDLVNEALNIYILNPIHTKSASAEHFVYAYFKCMRIKIANRKPGYLMMQVST